ncbi:hypothetical protein GW750_07445 [bacterium]|nr:hypothetical protein [bacterium]
MKEIHKKIVSNIRYIDYDTFYNSLLSVVESFNKEIKNEYMVVFDAPCSLNEL